MNSRRKPAGKKGGVSRREFARSAVLSATAAALPPAVLGQSSGSGTEAGQAPPAPPPARQAEAENMLQAILSKYGKRFTEAQKTDLRRLVLQQQSSLEALRSFSLDNSDQPATALRLLLGRRR